MLRKEWTRGVHRDGSPLALVFNGFRLPVGGRGFGGLSMAGKIVVQLQTSNIRGIWGASFPLDILRRQWKTIMTALHYVLPTKGANPEFRLVNKQAGLLASL